MKKVRKHISCGKCGHHIKSHNIIIIDGNYYGKRCAETILGIKLPKGFRGDWNIFLESVEQRIKDDKKEKLENAYKLEEFKPILSKIEGLISSGDITKYEVEFCKLLQKQIETEYNISDKQLKLLEKI